MDSRIAPVSDGAVWKGGGGGLAHSDGSTAVKGNCESAPSVPVSPEALPCFHASTTD